jgi:hypothetical protein
VPHAGHRLTGAKDGREGFQLLDTHAFSTRAMNQSARGSAAAAEPAAAASSPMLADVASPQPRPPLHLVLPSLRTRRDVSQKQTTLWPLTRTGAARFGVAPSLESARGLANPTEV